MNEQTLEALFSSFGQIISVRILQDNTARQYHEDDSLMPGSSRGVGFVRFNKRTEAERAILELNGTIPKGSVQRITVRFANASGMCLLLIQWNLM